MNGDNIQSPNGVELTDGIELKTNANTNANASNFSLTGQSEGFNFTYEPSFDNINAQNITQTAIQIGYKKAASTYIDVASTIRIIFKSMMSGSYLGVSITLMLVAISLEWDKVSAGLLFPTGFVMLILMGNDLATGNFALLPMAYLSAKKNEKKLSIKMILINWIVVYCGNFMGALLYLFFLWGGMTHFGHRDSTQYDGFKAVLCDVTTGKSINYKLTGGCAGWFASLFNGIMCNWMVTMGVLLSFSSKSTIGKIFAMYIPVTLFITLGFEHSIVNLFLFPAGLTYGCDTYNAADWWIWNQIPVTLGNMVGGICLTGIMYFVIWSNKL